MAGFGAKVKLNVDKSTAAKQEFNSQINSMVNQIKISNKFTVLQKDMDRVRKEAQAGLDAAPIKIKNIDCSQAVTKLRKDIQNVINSLSIKNGVTITGLVDPAGAGTIATDIRNVAEAAREGQAEVDRMNAQMNVLKTTMQSLAAIYKSAMPGGKNPIGNAEELNGIIARYTVLQQKIESIKSSNSIASKEELDALQKEALAIQQKIAAIQEEQVARAKAAAETARASAKAEKDSAKEQSDIERRNKLYEQTCAKLQQVKKAQDGWTAAATGKSRESYAQLDGYAQRLQNIITNFDSMDEKDIRSSLSDISAGFKNASTHIKNAGEDTKTFGERIGGLSKKFTTWLSISQVIMLAYRSIKKMVDAVIELDTAMTELRKVTNETDSTYSKFLDNAADRAKNIGATIADTVNASADFARLGYTLDESAQLADAALVYKNVGDGIEDISDASESIISTMKAFNIEASDAMFVVDKFNEVGNNFAISSKGVGDALLRSASALASGNNTLDESIALITAANSTVQDADKVGTTMKTVSMFLRAAKTEAEEAGESTEGMANSVSELRDEILALTGNKVDIQIDENTFKSTYQIMKELADIWGELTDISQANILEMIGGKRNSNVVMSLIENFDVAEDVLQSAANAYGSATEENEKFKESIKGTIAEFKATFEELSETLIDGDFVKDIVRLGTNLLEILTAVSKVIDTIGGLNTVLGITIGLIAIIKADSIVAFLLKLIAPIKAIATSIVAAKAAGITAGEFISNAFNQIAASASTAQIAVAAFVAVITVINLVKNAIENTRQEAIQAAQDAIATKDAAIESANAFKEAYLTYMEYADQANLTAKEEELLKSAIDKVNSSLEGKESTLQGLTAETEAYTEALREQAKAELESAYLDAKDKRVKAEDLIKETTWSDWDGSQITIDMSGRTGIDEFVDAYNVVEDMMGQFMDDGIWGKELEPINWDTNKDDISAVIEYYYELLDVKNELLRKDLTDNDIFDDIDDIVGDLKTPVETYVKAQYDELANWYEWQNGLPESIEEFKEFRDYIIDGLGDELNLDGNSLSAVVDSYLDDNSWYDSYLDQIYALESAETELNEKMRNIAETLVPKTYEDLTPGTAAHFHAIDNWLIEVEGIKDKLRSLSDEEFELAYDLVINQGVTTWEDVLEGIENYNSAEEVARRHTEKFKDSIRDLWDSEDFSEAKNDLTALAKTIDGISPDKIEALADESDVLATILEEDGMNAAFLANVLEQMALGNDGLALITEDALKLNDALDGMVGEFDRVTDAKSRYDAAMSVDEKDTDFRSYADAFAALNEQFEAGTTNSNAFWAAAEFLFGADQLALWGWSDGLDEIYSAMEKNKLVFSDADSAGAGFIERLYQMAEAGALVNDEGEKLLEISKDSNGGYMFDIDQTNIDEIAEKMGITEEAVLACLEALSMWGDVDFYNLEDVIAVIDEIGLSFETASGKAVNAELLTEQLLTLGKTEKEVHDILGALQGLDGVDLFTITGDVDTLTTSLTNLGFAADDGITITVDYEGIANLMSNLGYTKDEAEDLISKLGEADNISLTNASGEVKEVSDALEYINTITFAEVQTEVNDVAGAVGDLDGSSTDNVVSEIEGIGNEADITVTKVYNIRDAIDEVNGRECTVYYSVKQKGGILGGLAGILGFANGTDGAPKGDALVGEEGTELIQSGDRAYLAGVNGPEIVRLEEGDRVYTADETRKIISGGSGRHIAGSIPAFEGGAHASLTTNYTGGAHGNIIVAENKTGTTGDPIKVDVDVSLDDSDLEEQLKEKLEEMEKNIQEIIDNFEHSIFLLEKNGTSSSQIVAMYRKMQDAVHEQAEQYRALGLDENSDYIQNLQKQWWDYEDTINSVKQQVVDDLLDMVNATSDAVDDIQNVFDTLKKAADEYAENGGFISVDTFQEIMAFGPQYLQYLRDENGLLVINEESINRVLAAKTQQLALDNAMAYVERLRLALNGESLEDLNNLLYATTEATNATWGLVYANLGLLGLSDDQYQAALHNINAIRSLAENAVSGIGRVSANTSEHLQEMKQGLDDILQYVMDMLRDRIEQQIEALEEEKQAYADLIALKKESLEATQEETDYQDEVADKIREIAKLQERINQLSLDDSREAQSQKAKLEEEMLELQNELADTQADYAVDAQQDSLDKMQEAYEAEKDNEIAALEESISSTQKLYDMAIAYIQSNWSTLKNELIAWNYEVGNSLESELVTAWDNAYAAAQRYGSYVSALNSIDADIEATGSGVNNIVGETNYDTTSTNEEKIHAIIKEMYSNSQEHHTADADGKARLNKRNLTLGAMLAQYGITAVRGNDGVWYIGSVGGEKLYDKYRKYCYHNGGVAGDEPTLKQNEVMAVLEKGEPVLDKKKEQGLYRIIDFTSALSEKLGKVVNSNDLSRLFNGMRKDLETIHNTLPNVTNNQSEAVHFGDVYIYGGNEDTVEKHREVNRKFANDVLKHLNIKR